jgi:polyhydroxybutyrate depolymerase
MGMRLIPFLASVGVAMLSGCAPDRVVDGRAYELLSPDQSDATTSMPLMVVLHGYGFTGRGNDLAFPLSTQINDKKFRYALLNGTIDRSGKRFWNATDFCCDFDRLPLDDVQFVKNVIDDVKREHAVTAGHVFILGHSNGGFMATRIMCDAPELINGAIIVAGSTWLDETRCGRVGKVPLLSVHGTADDTIPYAGIKDKFPGVRETDERFGKRNGCGTNWKELSKADFLKPDGEETTKEALVDCPKNGAVELWTVEGAGHLPLFDKRWAAEAYDWLEAHAP